MAGEWEFRPAKCKGTSFKEKDKCPTLVADSLTLSVFKSSLCFSEKNCLSQYKWIPHPWGKRIKFSGHSTQLCLALQGGFFSPVLWVHEEGEPIWSVSCCDFCHNGPLHISIVAALTEAAKEGGCAWAALEELGSSCSERGGLWEINIPYFLSKQSLTPSAFGKMPLNYQVIHMEGHRSTVCKKFKPTQ